jgi:hypothetical protein
MTALRRMWRWGAHHPASYALAAAVVVLSCLAGVAGSTWLLTGDFSHTEFLVRSIPQHPPLIGVAARVAGGGSTPGPSMAYLLWPVYTLLGANAFALAASTAVLHVGAIAATVSVTGRLAGRLAAAAMALSFTVLVVSMAPRFFLEPWNVWIPVFAFPLFVVLVWAALNGRPVALPLAVAVGSHCVQTHISYTVLVLGTLAAAAMWWLASWWRARTSGAPTPWRWLAISMGTGVAMWLLPVIEQLQRGTGNLRKVYDQFTRPTEPYVGVGAAMKAMSGRFNLIGPWLDDPLRSPTANPNVIGFVLFCALVGGGAWCAWQRRLRVELTLYAVLTWVTLLGAVSTARIFGSFFEYVVRWMLPLVALWVGTATWSITRSVVSRRPAAHRHVVGSALVAAVVCAAVGVARGVAADVPYRADSDITAVLAEQLSASLDRELTYQINERDPVALGSVAFGLHLQLDKEGFHAGVGPWGRAGVKQFRVVDDSEADATLWYVAGDRLIAAVASLPGARVVAEFDVRTPSQVAESNRLAGEIVQVLCSAGRDDLEPYLYARWGYTSVGFQRGLPAEVVPLLERLTDMRQPAAVVQVPVGVDVNAAQVPIQGC